MNKKIENMERCFKRRHKALEVLSSDQFKTQESIFASHQRSVSIDLSNKENIDPNIGSSVASKHQQNKVVQRG